jgi:DNA-directed RNA polymerase subunit RPC12/RpoP
MKARVNNSVVAERILNAVRNDLLSEQSEMVKCAICGKEFEDDDEDEDVPDSEDEKEICPSCMKKSGNTTNGAPGVTADAAARAPGVVGNNGK